MSELKRTPLYERHIQLGAKMVPFAGFSMPVSYASVKDEILSVRNQTGIFDISHMQPIMIEARNADISISFLNKITARPIPPFSAGEVQYNALINQNGGIIDDILVYMFANGNVGIVANAANADKVIHFLGNHADDHIAIVPAQDYAFLAVQGKGSEKIVRETIGSFAEIFYY
ncbi:MAG: glycine cleavage system protein T, partial [Leptospiraceae bacterium]|nr:glycine cleavage system protein T [Leptospiraceae bacterium]